MSILCMKFHAVVGTLVELRSDVKHPDDATWATKLITLISGKDGFDRLVKFGIECDFAVATGLHLRLQDAASADISLSVVQVVECLEICEALFQEGRVFDLQDNHTYTGQLLRGFLRPVGSQQPGRLAAFSHAGIGWPADVSQDVALAEGRRYAKVLYKMAYKFLKLNFPDYSWRTKFGAFNFGPGAFPEAYRLDCLEKLAVKENLDKAQTRFQFEQVFSHMKRHYRESGENRVAWAKLLESLRLKKEPKKFRPDFSCVVSLTLTFIGILDVTTDVERAFSRLARLEIKSRERHCHPSRLHDSLNIVLEVPSVVDALVTRTPEPLRLPGRGKAPLLQILWRPGPVIRQAQRKYAEFFGIRCLASRSMEVLPLARRAQQLPKICVKKSAKVTPGRKCSKVKRRQAWSTSVQQVVKDMRAKKKRLHSQVPVPLCSHSQWTDGRNFLSGNR